MWSLGKLAALAASARIATRQQDRARRLAERIDLAREVHERVMHRLFAVSLALSADGELAPADRERCRVEMREALADLRTALERQLGPRPRTTGTTLRAAVGRLDRGYGDIPVKVDWAKGLEVPERLEPVAQATLGEALRNAIRHARPTAIHVRVDSPDDTFVLEVVNDGVGEDGRTATGMGLRLASLEALQFGGVVEFGPHEEGGWRTRLVVPL